MRDANAHASEARRQPLGRTLSPLDRAPGALRQAESKLLDRDRLMLVVAAKQLWWSSVARPFFRRQRPRVGRPHRGVWQDAGHIGQRQRADAGAQVRVAAISGIHQHHAARKPGSAGRFDLLKRDLWLGLEADLLGHARLAPTFVVCRPVLRQIETIHRRQTGVVIGKRQRHRDLTVILLAKLPAILTPHTDRVRSLLGETGVIDDPRFDRSMAFYRRQYHLAHFGQNTLVRPRRVADEVQQRLMLCRRSIGAVTAAIGSTLLRSPGMIKPMQ